MNLLLQRVIALVGLILASPLLTLLFFLVKLGSKGPFIFKQKRAGKNKKPFTMYKIRTMVEGAEKHQTKYQGMNEADGPVFKIKNDPRYTKIGKFLAKSAIDELPQLWNVARGEMALVGPRPLPINEAKKVPSEYNKRFSTLPGMTSLWVVGGLHTLKFKRWMELDTEYAKSKSTLLDAKILFRTFILVLKMVFGRKI